MSMTPTSIEKQVKAFCAKLGADPLLVQGAGGNVSWKDGGVLWVKASGTWLAEAELKEIFVPVNLAHLQDAIAKQDFSVKPELKSNSGLRPSIETLLHALMPQRVVIHLHAVEILTHLVKVDAKQKIEDLVGDTVNWIFVDYFKPGANLAKAVAEKLTNRPDADIIFMGNHGVVIGGENVEDVFACLNKLISKLQTRTLKLDSEGNRSIRELEFLVNGYIPCKDVELNLISNNYELLNRLNHEWAIYPDHVVFLGANPVILEKNFGLLELAEVTKQSPPFIFVPDFGVYESLNATNAQKSQLRCYFDVINRLNSSDILSPLTYQQISELLDWDAEKYRKNLTDSNLGR